MCELFFFFFFLRVGGGGFNFILYMHFKADEFLVCGNFLPSISNRDIEASAWPSG